MPEAVEISDLSHRYGDRVAIDRLSLSIRPGELFGLLGPNGSGKSTLFRILSTLVPPQTGDVFTLGLSHRADVAAIRRQIGVVFQAPALDRMLSARENLRHQGHLYGLRRPQLQTRIDHCLGLVGMSDRADRRTAQLSGGERRRVELAKSLLHEPKLLILDEPGTGLDPAARLDFAAALEQLRAGGTTILLTTHQMDEAERCTRLAIIDAGKLITSGSPAQLRGELAGDIITLCARDNASAKTQLSTLGFDVAELGSLLQVTNADPPTALSRIMSALGGELQSITVSKPTLENVFLKHTGRAFEA